MHGSDMYVTTYVYECFVQQVTVLQGSSCDSMTRCCVHTKCHLCHVLHQHYVFHEGQLHNVFRVAHSDLQANAKLLAAPQLCVQLCCLAAALISP